MKIIQGLASQNLREWLGYYGRLSFPIRLLLTAIATTVGSSGLGFVAELAAYRYAYCHNLRPPLEGVPYLRVAVTMISFVTIIGGAVMFLAVSFLSQVLLDEADKWLRSGADVGKWVTSINVDLRRLIESIPPRVVVPLSIAAGVIATITYETSIRDWTTIGPLTLDPSFLFGAFVAMAILVLWRRALVYPVAIFAALLAIIVIPLLLFDTQIYGALLRTIGYGGGLPIDVTYEEADKAKSLKASLMLRTSEAIIVYDSGAGVVREIPIGRVTHISTQPTPLWGQIGALPARLP